jgi:hypothetical protein
MKCTITSIIRMAATAAMLLGLGGASSACDNTRKADDALFAGAFGVTHVVQFRLDGVQQVDISGAGCVTESGDAMCDNNNTQEVFMPPPESGLAGWGRADYTIKTRSGKIVLHLEFDPAKGTADLVKGEITFGGTFTVAPGSGTGCFKGATGDGLWSGSAEFTGPPDATGKMPPGPGRWAFWGLIRTPHRHDCR